MGSSLKKLDPGADLSAYIENIINETVKSALHSRALEEKEKQGAQVAAASGASGNETLFGDDGGDTDEKKKPEEPSKTVADDREALEGKVEVKDVIEKLNAIRSGKSLKDSMISKAFDSYFNSLKDAEKVALFAFMKGIAQIVTGEVSGETATEPSEKPADVTMKKGPEIKKRHLKPNVIKKPAPAGGSPKAPPKENTTPPSPITPKKR